MSVTRGRFGPLTCDEARDAMQARMDGELRPGGGGALDAHMQGCAACRDHWSGLVDVRSALRSLPLPPLPDAALEEVWGRTVGEPRAGRHRVAAPWRLVASSAAAAVLIATLAWLGLQSHDRVREAEVARAAADARLAFRLASQAIDRGREAALRDVLMEQVSPALRKHDRVIRWPVGSERRRQRGSDV